MISRATQKEFMELFSSLIEQKKFCEEMIESGKDGLKGSLIRINNTIEYIITYENTMYNMLFREYDHWDFVRRKHESGDATGGYVWNDKAKRRMEKIKECMNSE